MDFGRAKLLDEAPFESSDLGLSNISTINEKDSNWHTSTILLQEGKEPALGCTGTSNEGTVPEQNGCVEISV